MTTSRDLFLLATVAYQQQRYDSAGGLFAAAMNAADAPTLIQELHTLEIEGPADSNIASEDKEGTGNLFSDMDLEQGDSHEASMSTNLPQDGMSLSSIVQVLSEAMKDEDEGTDNEELIFDDEDQEDSSLSATLPTDGEEEEEIDPDEGESDDPNPAYPGQTITPSGISPALSSAKVRPDVSTSGNEFPPITLIPIKDSFSIKVKQPSL